MPKEIQTLLEIVQDCDSLPYPDQSVEYELVTSRFYRFQLRKAWDEKTPEFVTVGYMLPEIVAKMPWSSKFQVDHDKRTVSIIFARGDEYETTAIKEQLQTARENDSFRILRQWRPELYSILGVGRDVQMARGGSALFGIHTVGVHLLGYTKDQVGELRLWIPQRAFTKNTYPGMLDNTVGGGLTTGEDHFECLLRGAREEASLPEDWMREHAKAVGTISYFSIRDSRAGGETGLLQPATQVLYDVAMPSTMIPKPSDGDVQDFHLKSVAETIVALKEGNFKPNSAVAWIDFLIRHGHLTANNEPDYMELVSRIHRRICF